MSDTFYLGPDYTHSVIVQIPTSKGTRLQFFSLFHFFCPIYFSFYSLILKHQYLFLCPIKVNIYTSNLTAGRLQNQKLTPDIRALIFGAAVDGQNYRGISARFNVSISTVSRKIKKIQPTNQF